MLRHSNSTYRLTNKLFKYEKYRLYRPTYCRDLADESKWPPPLKHRVPDYSKINLYVGRSGGPRSSSSGGIYIFHIYSGNFRQILQIISWYNQESNIQSLKGECDIVCWYNLKINWFKINCFNLKIHLYFFGLMSSLIK